MVLALMLTAYAVLDGFDLGAGIVHRLVARTDEEREQVLAAIGPVWDGNEVWLVAGGGVFVFAFPRAYAAAFSGFYLPLMLVLWLLITRGVAIELRSRHESPLWRSFFDANFTFASIVLSIVLGVALGNVVRGVPLDASGFFRTQLFTDLRVGLGRGAIDWFTLLVGVLAFAALGLHGALYLNLKTTGLVQERSARLARMAWLAVAILCVAVTFAVALVQPVLLARLASRPWSWPLPLLALAGLALVPLALHRRNERPAFWGSGLLIVGLLAATAAVLFPDVLYSRIDPSHSLTIQNAANDRRGLKLALAWWVPALLLALGYFTYLFRSFAGKVRGGEDRLG
jgi:cytochrome d ubiquinol oxidase subunit II